MKLNFFLLVFCSFTVSLKAQQRTQLLPTIIKNNVITMRAEMVDLTGDTFILGYLPMPDNSNERIAITTPVAKQAWLNASIGNAAKAFVSLPNPVLYIVNDISVGHLSNGNYVRLKAVIYENTPAGYTLPKTVDTFVTDKAPDINSIGDLINTAIISTAAQLNTSATRGRPMSKQEVIEKEKNKSAFISNGATASGIYLTFNEFKTGKPSFDQFHIKNDTSAQTVEVQSFTEGDSTLTAVTPWGVSVNNELYVYKNKKLYLVEAVGNNLVFSKFLDPNNRKNNAAFWQMTIGNNYNDRNKNVFDNVNTLRISNYRGRGLSGDAVKINSDTGMPEL